MKGERSESAKLVPPGRVQAVLSYRVAVKVLAKALLELAQTGSISENALAQVEEVTRGKV